MNINPSGNRSNYTIPRQDMKYSPVKCSLASVDRKNDRRIITTLRLL